MLPMKFSDSMKPIGVSFIVFIIYHFSSIILGLAITYSTTIPGLFRSSSDII